MNSSSIIGKKIFVLIAHPDDESFAAAGTLYENHQSGGENILVCATLGEKGSSHLDREVTPEELQKIRQKELQSAANMLGVTKVYELGFPDGELNKHELDIHTKTARLISKHSPGLLMSFGPDGLTGHKDHIAISNVARKLASEFSLPLAQYCFPKSIIANVKKSLHAKRAAGNYNDNFELQEGNIQININGEFKLSVLRQYASQIDADNPFATFPKEIEQALLSQECFRYIEIGEK